MVGRGRERERLRADFAERREARTCRLFTLIGPAGRRQVAARRGLPRATSRSRGSPAAARSRTARASRTGRSSRFSSSSASTRLDAIRRRPPTPSSRRGHCWSSSAEEQPLVLVLDDLHWAEPPMLDLVEHVADWSRERADPAPLRRAPGAARRAAGLGWRQAQRDLGAARAARRPRRRRRSLGDCSRGVDLDDDDARRASSRPPRATRSSSRRWPRSRARRAARVERAADDPGAPAGAARHARRRPSGR